MNTQKPIYQSLIPPAGITAIILLIPLIAMQFTNEVLWDLTDFIVAGILIFGSGTAYTLITRKSGKSVYRTAIGFALLSAFLLIWVNGAVGVIGSEDNSINLWYFGVIGIGVIGGLITRFKPLGMKITLFAMAFAQTLITSVALISGAQNLPYSSVTEILGVNGFFIILFVVAGLLFRHADRSEESELA